MFPEACREDRLRAGLCSVRRQSYSGFVASHLSCTYVQISSASPQKKKDTYVPQHPPGTRAFRGARACTLSCALPLSQPCATCAHTYPDAGVYVRTYFRECVRAHVRLDGRCRRRLASSSGAIALAEATRQRGAGQGCFRRHAPCAADNGEWSRAHREKFGAGHDK